MASLTIRNLDDDLKARLRLRAAQHGQSMEEELRTILREVLAPHPVERASLAERIGARFAEVHRLQGPQANEAAAHDEDWVVPARQPARRPPAFD